MDVLQNLTISGVFVLLLGIILFACIGILVGWAANLAVVNKLTALSVQNEQMNKQLILMNNNLVDLYNLQVSQLPEGKKAEIEQQAQEQDG